MFRDTGPPPGPEMRRPGDKTWPTRECRFSEPTIDSYSSGSQTSRGISADELSRKEWTCRHDVFGQGNMSPKEAACRS
jgi:hypothetical protein